MRRRWFALIGFYRLAGDHGTSLCIRAPVHSRLPARLCQDM
jgi:hypothetical protein